MPEDNRLGEINQKLERIQDDVNDIQGDVRILSTLNKELNKGELKSEIYTKFGGSTAKKKIWYYADGEQSVTELHELTGFAYSTVSRYCNQMNKSGVLVEHDSGSSTYYNKAEVTEDIGIEQEFEEDIDDL